MTTNSAPTSSRGDLASAPTVPLAPQRQGCSHLVRIVHYEEGEREAAATETWLQACATDDPFALELVGTRRDQGFVLRASNQAQLTLLTKQFEAQYPQAEVQHLAAETDPLLLAPGEHAVVGLFRLARPSWMPIKTFIGKALALPGGRPHSRHLRCDGTTRTRRAPDLSTSPGSRPGFLDRPQPAQSAGTPFATRTRCRTRPEAGILALRPGRGPAARRARPACTGRPGRLPALPGAPVAHPGRPRPRHAPCWQRGARLVATTGQPPALQHGAGGREAGPPGLLYATARHRHRSSTHVERGCPRAACATPGNSLPPVHTSFR